MDSKTKLSTQARVYPTIFQSKQELLTNTTFFFPFIWCTAVVNTFCTTLPIHVSWVPHTWMNLRRIPKFSHILRSVSIHRPFLLCMNAYIQTHTWKCNFIQNIPRTRTHTSRNSFIDTPQTAFTVVVAAAAAVTTTAWKRYVFVGVLYFVLLNEKINDSKNVSLS